MNNKIIFNKLSACHITALKGFRLDVKIVHWGSIKSGYEKLPTRYPLAKENIEIDSVWDTWAKKNNQKPMRGNT